MRCRFGIIVIFLHGISMSIVQSTPFQYLRNSKVDRFVSDTRVRYDVPEKRAISRVVKGIAAVRKLTMNSMPVPIKSQVYRRYEKPGDFETAVREFYSVKPTNVKTYEYSESGFSNARPNGRVVSGNVGNRRLLLKENGEAGRPTIDVIETKLEPGPYIDQIVYKGVKT